MGCVELKKTADGQNLLALNVLQVLLRNQLNDVNLVITIPIFSIMFALIVLLLAKYILHLFPPFQEI